MNEESVIRLNHFQYEKRIQEIKALTKEKKRNDYEGEFNLFKKWCSINHFAIDFYGADKYLLHEVEVEVKGIRLNTLNRKVAALRFYLSEINGYNEPDAFNDSIQALRDLYNFEPYLEKKGINPVTFAMQKEEALSLIEKFNTDKPEDIRIYAICLVNLITANRPSEMVRLLVKDFDFSRREVAVKLIKQKTLHRKRLTMEALFAVQRYISSFKLISDDYFVGKVDKWGNYSSIQINSNTYRQNIKKWINVAPYMLRKTQITSMHRNKADLATIARQSGHKSVQTISEHYIKLDSTDLDDYI
ncbi:site-specific integrase [Lysinibacillus xylanilyticus]|uniref:tyrosine-type recombinase/integrase n=1 Tax=Lysinibacillus xylanilyticus TaxID=582475 RepID=UPI002B241A3D|nr:tyrosine-type recombinase/integrase [Lysinibacillus xylanilyticus]MEB2282580.1 site-specific integrase [Lysinibacillus xylanilyticus]